MPAGKYKIETPVVEVEEALEYKRDVEPLKGLSSSPNEALTLDVPGRQEHESRAVPVTFSACVFTSVCCNCDHL